MGRKVLVIGSGGREHAIVWALKYRSLDIEEIYCVPGNAGISEIARCLPELDWKDFSSLIGFAKDKGIDLTVVGPEAPLVAGIVDAFREAGLTIFGPSKVASQLEGSKVWAKNLMKKYRIPTAEFETFNDPEKALDYIQQKDVYPIVIKADGLAGGKGVIIAENFDQAKEAIEEIMLHRRFGTAGDKVVVEEYLQGEEVSIIAVTDGEYILPMLSSQDHKAIYDGDRGPNTGGMGAYSSAPIVDYSLSKRIESEILFRLLEGLKREGIEYKGVIYAGLMITEDGPKVLEFNVRLGDPEAQAILPRFRGDFFDLLLASATQGINKQVVNWDPRQCVCVVLASRGYPGKYETGKVIYGLEKFVDKEDILVFHAGTRRDDKGRIVTAGGRVLGVTALGKDLKEARDKAYSAVEEINFEGKYYRRDIAEKGIRRLEEIQKSG